MIKNVTGKWLCHAFNPYTGAPVTGDAANITANLRLDFGASNPVDDVNPTELERGDYYFDITQAEANADHIAICPVSATANVIVVGAPPALYTESDFTATQKASITAAVPAVDLSGVATATDLATIDGIVDAIKARTDTLGTGITSFPPQAYTITSDGLPCADCLVVMTTDAIGSNPIHNGTTDALGQVTFYPDLPAGTAVYLWRFKTGVNFVNPDVEATS